MLAQNADDECFVCFDVMWEPSKTPCGHYLCLTCLENVLVLKRSCPFCRTEVPGSFVPKLDKKKQNDIKVKRGPEFELKMAEIKEQRLKCDTITVVYGNSHKIVHGSGSNTHSWAAFVRLADSKLDISKYIKKVVFILHPTFMDPIREIHSPPFQVKCLGWGVFLVPIVIHWQPWFEKEPTKVSHFLSFSGDGDSRTNTIKFNKSIFQNMDKDEQEEQDEMEEDDEDGWVDV